MLVGLAELLPDTLSLTQLLAPSLVERWEESSSSAERAACEQKGRQGRRKKEKKTGNEINKKIKRAAEMEEKEKMRRGRYFARWTLGGKV